MSQEVALPYSRDRLFSSKCKPTLLFKADGEMTGELWKYPHDKKEIYILLELSGHCIFGEYYNHEGKLKNCGNFLTYMSAFEATRIISG